MTTEWPARLSAKGDKILCGRPTGARGHCDGMIAYVRHNQAPRTYITLPRGEIELSPGYFGPSPRAAGRLADSRKPTARTARAGGADVLPLDSAEVQPPFRKICPSCAVLAFVPGNVLP